MATPGHNVLISFVNSVDLFTHISIFQNTTVTALLNGQPVFSGEVPLKNKRGFLAIGTDNFGLAHFNNFTVSFP